MVDQSKERSKVLRSTLSSKLLKQTLKRGSCLAIPGALVIIFAGTLSSLDFLKMWGIPLFLGGLLLIAIGLRPYRMLDRLQLKPHALHLQEQGVLFYCEGKPCLHIPKSAIAFCTYVKKGAESGLTLELKRPIIDKIKVLQPQFHLDSFLKRSRHKAATCDLYFPHFSQADCETFQSYFTSRTNDSLL